MVGSKFVSETEDAVGARFKGVEVVVRTFEGSKVFVGEVFRELFNRKMGEIIGHSIEI